jgi:transcriptional regulator of acetoin/glycerol metabolism
LLRVLSESEIQPVGALKPKPVKFRLLSASHHDLAVLAAQGRFREDLLYRLNAATLTLPALRNRQDFDSLVDQLLRRIGDEEGEKLTIDRSAKAKLAVYRWPGNLRELDNTLRVAAAMAASQIITTDCLPDHLQPDIFENNDQPTLRSQLDACGNNISALARKLGVNRSTIHRRLKQSQR